MIKMLKLDIGCGGHPLEGYEPVDIKHGKQAYPLSYQEGSADEIHASHILEHFPHGQIHHVLGEWIRVLRPGGRLRISVPDFEVISRAYLEGKDIPVQGYVMGGQLDEHDVHRSLFDMEALMDVMSDCGLIGIGRWKSRQPDCSSLPISLNLQGYKPPAQWPKTIAVMSTPRLGFNDMWGCTIQTLGAMHIPIVKHTGAFWEQCITRAMEQALEEDPTYILTLDYDSVFVLRDVQSLIMTALRMNSDALAALQVHRCRPTPLMTMKGKKGESIAAAPYEIFQEDVTEVATAHFGLTLIRADKLRNLPKPWFHGEPNESGHWDDARIDPDIYFWRKWETVGNRLHVANRIPIGHLQTVIRWPGSDISATLQHPDDFHEGGKPEDIWR